MDYTDKNPDKFSIVIGDIFNYEKEIYYNSKNNDDTASFLRTLYIEMESHLRGYGTKYIRKSNDEFRNIREDFSCDYFYSQNDIYYYTERCVVNKDDRLEQPFNFFFALTLRQYERKLSEIYGFLDYQLSGSFKSDLEDFLKSLKYVLLQHEKLFSQNVVDITNEWITEKKQEILLIQNSSNAPKKEEKKTKSLKEKEVKTPEEIEEIDTFEKLFYDILDIERINKILKNDNIINKMNEWLGSTNNKYEILVLIDVLEKRTYIRKIKNKTTKGSFFAVYYKLQVSDRLLREDIEKTKNYDALFDFYSSIIPERIIQKQQL